ncbi:MAG: hypothetical protein JNK49_16785 [Planctomycetes bacterium]|nr:hypothetical protein [Planctomycetota bacterium]
MNLRSLPLPSRLLARSVLVSLCLGAFSTHTAMAQGTPKSAKGAFQDSPAWRELLAADDGGWQVDWNPATGTPRAIYGRGLPLADWRGNSLEEARRHALTVLRDRSELLGLGTSEFREAIGSRMGRTWAFVFDQYYRGLPCLGGRADVRVSMAGRIAMLGSTAWQIPVDFDTAPGVPAEVARLTALQQLAVDSTIPADAPQTAGEPRLVIWGDAHAATPQRPVLAWEVPVHALGAGGVGRIGRQLVDARTGALLSFLDDKHECGLACGHGPEQPRLPVANAVVDQPLAPLAAPVPTTLTVYGGVRTSTDMLAPVATVPMPGLQVQVGGHGTFVTDANGQFTVDLFASASVTVTPLDGIRHAPVMGSDTPPGSFGMLPGGSGWVQVGGPSAPETHTAHLNAAWWTHRTNEFVRSVLGDTPQLAVTDNMGITVNVALNCNAYYNGNSMVFYATGGGCRNLAESTIIAHEWGHGLDDRYGGISQTNGLSEGWGDILATYLTDQPSVGEGIQGAGTRIRTAVNARQYPSGSGVHQQGESWMGFAWQLRERLATTRGRPTAIAVSNSIVLGSIVANAQDQTAAMLEVWLADDNDGDLTNGTPHAAELIHAANLHSIPTPAPAGVPNDECAFPYELAPGLNGPFSNVGATMSGATLCVPSGADVWFSYLVGASGTLEVTTCALANFDTVIAVYSGDCGALQLLSCVDDSCSLQTRVQVAVQPGLHRIRVAGYNGATGSFSLQVTGPQGSYGTTSTFGTACGARSRSAYEWLGGGQFDLANSAFRMTRQGNRYLVQPGGAWIPPSGAAVDLGHVDDSVRLVNLASPFPYVGGVTSQLFVGSNGWVAVGPGNSINPTIEVGEWLASPDARWGTHHDYDPSAPGSGRILRETIGNLEVITWNGVYTFGFAQANFQQLQLDRSNGNVTFAFLAMPTPESPSILGYAAGNDPSGTSGARDFSAALPATFTTSNVTQQAPTLTSNLPRLGRQLTFTSTFAPTANLGVLALGLQALDPGIPLNAAGLPGCRQHTSAEVTVLMLPTAGQATYSMSIPQAPSLVGLPLVGQTVASPSSGLLADIAMSRGLRATVGF